jgi:pyruvate dehydrogenase E2 component (dihydrolipoamide acetyltransferase)
LAIVREEETQPAVLSPAPKQSASVVPAEVPSAPRRVATVPPRAAQRLAISPSARRRARELGVDPSTLQGTGPSGAITLADIEGAAKRSTGIAARTDLKPAPTERPERSARMRQAIAAAMARSKREIPHYYLGTTLDMHAAMSWLAEANTKRSMSERMLYGVLLLKAVALALREAPELNACWVDDHAEQRPGIHVGVAISLRQGGLVAPAVHDTDKLTLDELMTKLNDLVTRARAGSLRSSELGDPTITVTSLGEQGVESVFGVIYPPQVALVGFGKLVERPWSVDGQIVSRQVITATLSADHRVSDGHRGARFLDAVDRLLQEPAKL